MHADTTPPKLIAGYLETNGTIRLVFNEPINPLGATVLGNYHVTNMLGQVRPVESALVTNGTNVILRFASLPTARYNVWADGLRDASVLGNMMRRTGIAVGMDALVQPMGGTWRYDDTGMDRGVSWTAVNYDASGWGVGQALFGAQRGTLPWQVTELMLSNATATAQIPAYYFRATFQAFSAPTGYVTLRLIADDGCVVYLNGLEILRVGMPAGVIGFGTLATRTITTPAVEGPILVAVSNLVDGANVIAVEVHQASLTSADVYWAGEVSVRIPPLLFPDIVIDECQYVMPWPTLHVETVSSMSKALRFRWTNPVTNIGPFCERRSIFMLQQTPEWKTLPHEPGPIGVIWNPGSQPNISEWFDVGTNSPVTVYTTNAMRFYRLKVMP